MINLLQSDKIARRGDKEYVSLLIGLYKNNGSVLHVIISFL